MLLSTVTNLTASVISIILCMCNNIWLQSTDAADLRRAYRKLSLHMHPDKNKEQDAEIKFRQVYVPV